MPGGDFYAGLPLAEKLRKFVDHHHDQRVRHISQDEAVILNDAISRLEAGYGKSKRKEEFDALWERLEHIYTTRITAPNAVNRSLLVVTVPSRGRPTPPRDTATVFGLRLLAAGDSNPRNAQLALNLLVAGDSDIDTDLADAWERNSKRRSPPVDPAVEESDNELLNRALYQPTVPIEASPPSFASFSEVAVQFPDGWIGLAADHGHPVAIAVAGGMVLIFKLLKGPTEGLSEGLRERLYEWSRPPKKSSDKGVGDASTAE